MQQSLPRHQRLLLLLLLIILQLGGSVSSSEVPSSTNSYQTSYNGNNFSHLELYTDPTGRELVLVAQKNALIRLSPDLSQSSRTLLGPLNDSKTCMPHQIHQGMPNCHLAPMDNYIRAVDIVNGSMLHFCMSYLSGSCASVRLTALDAPLLVNTTAVAEVLSESVDGLLCRNPESDIFLTVSDRSLGRGGSVPDALYLTMPFCASRRDKIEPTLAIVDPQTLRKFAVSEEFNFFQAEIVSRRDFIRPGRLAHHASFRRVSKDARGLRRSCVYLVLTARAGPLRRARLRLARLCSADLSLSNYVEALVDCGGCGTLKGRDEVDCVGRAAAVAPAGRHLARHLNISSTSDTEVLFLTSSHNNRSGSECPSRSASRFDPGRLVKAVRRHSMARPTCAMSALLAGERSLGFGRRLVQCSRHLAGIVSANPDRVTAPFRPKFPSLRTKLQPCFGGYKTVIGP
uniref:Sema domain-containing protein n=1 Tax=Macrostomum lignano TaxID=282301 RepID=A0A1I8IID2_9PLAT